MRRAGDIFRNLWCAMVEYENDAIICLCLHSITLSLRTTQHLQLYAEKKMILLACWFRSMYAKAMCLLSFWMCCSRRKTSTVLCPLYILGGSLCTFILCKWCNQDKYSNTFYMMECMYHGRIMVVRPFDSLQGHSSNKKKINSKRSLLFYLELFCITNDWHVI